MANTNIALGTGFPFIGLDRMTFVEFELNFAEHNLVSTDSFDIINIEAGTVVAFVTAQCLTPEGAILTMGVGDSASATQFLTAFDGDSATIPTLAAATTNKVYDAANAIRVTANDDADVAVVRVTALLIDIRDLSA